MASSKYITYSIIAGIFQVQVICLSINLDKEAIKSAKSGNWYEKSDGCHSPCDKNEWRPWEQWSSCDIPIAGNPHDKPQCYNSLQNRRRSCTITNSTCKEFNWKLCLHEESCTGQWSQWTVFVGNCSGNSTTQTRNRTCIKDGEIAYGLCYPSSYNLEIDVEVKVCFASDDVHIYAATIGIRGLLFIATVVLAVWVTKRCNKDKQENRQRKNRLESTYRHYSFAVDNIDLQVASSAMGSTDNFYEETCEAPSPSAMPFYASADEVAIPVNEPVYETPLPSTSLKLPRDTHLPSSTALNRSRSVDDVITNQTKLYESIEEQHCEASKGVTLSSLENLTRQDYRSQLPTTTTTINNNAESDDDDIYTPMSSPTTKDPM